MVQLHKSQENPYVAQAYDMTLGEVGGPKAHQLLHTHYHSRKRISDEDLTLTGGEQPARLSVNVCVGTSCFIRGAQNLLHRLLDYVQDQGLSDTVEVNATFCFERCDRGPTVAVGDTVIEKCTFDKATAAIQEALENVVA